MIGSLSLSDSVSRPHFLPLFLSAAVSYWPATLGLQAAEGRARLSISPPSRCLFTPFSAETFHILMGSVCVCCPAAPLNTFYRSIKLPTIALYFIPPPPSSLFLTFPWNSNAFTSSCLNFLFAPPSPTPPPPLPLRAASFSFLHSLPGG